MTDRSWNVTKKLVYERANGCCEYCQTCEANTGQAMHIEHIDPTGGDSPDNLCLSCANCNLSKAKVTVAADPETGQTVPLFNPRTQVWVDHFTWIDAGVRLRGLTSIGRATIERLRINQSRMVIARARWVESGYHPPDATGT